MPAELVPQAAIPALAAQVTRPMLEALRQAQNARSVLNRPDLDAQTARHLEELAQLGLVDVVYEGDVRDRPYLWASNSNGARVLSYLTGLRAGPHYEIPSRELAAWLREQGEDGWWNVDGDSLLTGRMTFPCPAEALANELRGIDRPLLVQAKVGDREANGQVIGRDRLNEIVGHFADNLRVTGPGEGPRWGQDRLLYLCWKGRSEEWLLAEDSETAEEMRAAGVAAGSPSRP